MQTDTTRSQGIRLHTHDTWEKAFIAASQEAAMTMATQMPVVLYEQAGRQFLVTSFPMHFVADRVKIDNLRKGEDPDSHYNRPLIPEHVRTIASYLRDQESYILPPLTLCVEEELAVYVPESNSAVRMGIAVLPQSAAFLVTDGQHRIKAIQEAIRSGEEVLRGDGIAVTIVSEKEIEKVHQDFVDCAQTKAISPALLTAFNVRDPLSKLVRRIAEEGPVFNGRIEKVGTTVGKNSVKVFTMNQLRAGVAELLIGNSIQTQAKLRLDATERLEDDESFSQWLLRILEFYRKFAASNDQWTDLYQKTSKVSLDQVNTKALRDQYLHFTATGLVIMGRVGHAIFQESVTQGPEFESQKIRELAEIDWRRDAEIWRGNVVTMDGKVNTQNAPVSTAVISVKKTLGLALTPNEVNRELRLSEGTLEFETVEA